MPFWRRKRKVKECGFDPFAFMSETHGDNFSDASPLFSELLKGIKKEVNLKAFSKKEAKVNYWLVVCPYCGEVFKFQPRCPRCNNLVRVDFKEWNRKLDSYLSGEISKDELLQVNVRPFNLDGLEELREKWIDEDIPKEELQFTYLVRKGFDKIYKLYSPNQMLVILNIIKKIRKMENRETLTLALLDFVSYNSMFSWFKEENDTVYSIFHMGEPRINWKWLELSEYYIRYSIRKVIREEKKECKNYMVTHPFTLDMKLYKNVLSFYYAWAKRPLSENADITLQPGLLKEHFFVTVGDGFYHKEMDFVEDVKLKEGYVYLDKLDEKSLLYLMNSRIEEISRVGGLYRIKISGEKKGRTIVNELLALNDKVTGNDVEVLLMALTVTLNKFTSYEKILGAENNRELLKKYVFPLTLRILSSSLGLTISDKKATVYLIGKVFGKSKEFFRLLYMMSGTKVKFTPGDNSVLGIAKKIIEDPEYVNKVPFDKMREAIKVAEFLKNHSKDSYIQVS